MISEACRAELAQSESAFVTQSETTPESASARTIFLCIPGVLSESLSKRRASKIPTAGIKRITDLPLTLQLTNPANIKVPSTQSPRNRESDFLHSLSSEAPRMKMAAPVEMARVSWMPTIIQPAPKHSRTSTCE